MLNLSHLDLIPLLLLLQLPAHFDLTLTPIYQRTLLILIQTVLNCVGQLHNFNNQLRLISPLILGFSSVPNHLRSHLRFRPLSAILKLLIFLRNRSSGCRTLELKIKLGGQWQAHPRWQHYHQRPQRGGSQSWTLRFRYLVTNSHQSARRSSESATCLPS